MNPKATLKPVLSVVAFVMVLAVMSGCSLFDSEYDPTPIETTLPTQSTPTEPTPPTQSTPSEPSTPTAPTGPQIDFNLQGYLFNDERENIDTAFLAAQGPLSSSSEDDNTGPTHISVNGFPDCNLNDSSFLANERNNGILEISFYSSQHRRDPETGNLYIFTEVIYTMYIDRNTSKFLMCDIKDYHTGSVQQYYFTTSANPQIISDTLMKAYND